MLADNPITAFVATGDREAAKAFYRDTLGLRLIEDSEADPCGRPEPPRRERGGDEHATAGRLEARRQ